MADRLRKKIKVNFFVLSCETYALNKAFAYICANREDINPCFESKKAQHELLLIKQEKDGYSGMMGKYRNTMLPSIKKPGIPNSEREINIEQDEQLLEKTTFKYFNNHNILIIQRNIYSSNEGSLCKFLCDAIPGENIFNYAPIVSLKTIETLLANNSMIKDFEISLAKPTNPQLFDENNFSQAIMTMLNSSKALTVDISLKGNMRDRSFLNREILNIYQSIQNRFRIKKAKITQVKGESIDLIDLLNDKLYHEEIFNLTTKYPPFSVVMGLIMTAYNQKQEFLERYFG